MSPILSGGDPSGLPIPPSGLPDVEWVLMVANQQLQDETGTKWDPSNLMAYLNLAITEIIGLKPEAYNQTYVTTLIAGIKQPLPSSVVIGSLTLDFIDLINVNFNMGTTGLVRGSAIIHIPKGKMDNLLPDWPTFPAASIVNFFITDDRDPSNMYVFPPQPSTGNQYVEMLLSVNPPEITQVDDPLYIDVSYKPACVDYVVGRALSEETTIPNAFQKGQAYMQKFLQHLGLKTNVERVNEQKEK